ncbi:ParB/RepB/Spo0J family partition protein [Sedimentitalea nanhaiensis]|uniref:Chromosome segregation protein Spo0J, contains ParB-like nuclease domain n=1 Tax=Sedimentitalea nanhaiensis TaxID=999627 RepID=A0A1I7E218_9RHOB|nr:ParB N-terminal domain-containing protein [Sedimentitalea nanhaiensis]SFU17959.1 Chromosome segregation protein Spo0J, contains ParB-like nuclease domain [Sedimentitalea nanhaiensis]
MAKRKRLTPAQPGYLQSNPPAPSRGPLGAPPIAQVAGDASASAALAELSDTLGRARAEGRMIETLALDSIDETHLVRDRMGFDPDEMAALLASLEARGQQTPIEVVALPEPKNGKTHGLISGWRRLTALRRLQARTGEARFATVQARVITPADVQGAYVAMVEENEIRAALSLYEKGRIALQAVHRGIYPTPRAALRGLFGSVSRSRRSKIGSFLTLVEPLDRLLNHPAQIPEKLGLGLARALEDHRFATALRLRLRDDVDRDAETELQILWEALHSWTGPQQGSAEDAPPPDAPPVPSPTVPAPPSMQPRITGPDPESVARRLMQNRVAARFDAEAGRIELTGGGVDADLFAALQIWLKTR